MIRNIVTQGPEDYCQGNTWAPITAFCRLTAQRFMRSYLSSARTPPPPRGSQRWTVLRSAVDPTKGFAGLRSDCLLWFSSTSHP